MTPSGGTPRRTERSRIGDGWLECWRTALAAALAIGLLAGAATARAGDMSGRDHQIVDLSASCGGGRLDNPGSGQVRRAYLTIGQPEPIGMSEGISEGMEGVTVEIGLWPAMVTTVPEPANPLAGAAALGVIGVLASRRHRVRRFGNLDTSAQ